MRVLQIDGVKYSAELFRAFAAPDPTKYYQLVRKGESVTVTQYRVGDFDCRGCGAKIRNMAVSCPNCQELFD